MFTALCNILLVCNEVLRFIYFIKHGCNASCNILSSNSVRFLHIIHNTYLQLDVIEQKIRRTTLTHEYGETFENKHANLCLCWRLLFYQSLCCGALRIQLHISVPPWYMNIISQTVKSNPDNTVERCTPYSTVSGA